MAEDAADVVETHSTPISVQGPLSGLTYSQGRAKIHAHIHCPAETQLGRW